MSPKVIAIMQPVYMPWLGYFEQMAHAGHFVFYDDVQYTRQDWRNRNQILTPSGPIWLTVPVKKAPLGTAINRIEIDNKHYWVSKHLKSIALNYKRAPHFEGCFEMLRTILEQDWTRLADLDVALTQAICAELKIAPVMSRSSELPGDPRFTGQFDSTAADPVVARRNMRLVELCLHHGADIFYVGARARDYIDTDLFACFGLGVVFQNYVHPVYPQQSSLSQSHMSIIDLMMNVGPEARGILLSSPVPEFVRSR